MNTKQFPVGLVLRKSAAQLLIVGLVIAMAGCALMNRSPARSIQMTMGGMIAPPGSEDPSLAVNLVNRSNKTYEVTVTFDTPDPDQKCKVTRQIYSRKSEVFECSQKGIIPDVDYPIIIAIHFFDSQGDKQLAGMKIVKFNFGVSDIKAFEEMMRGDF